MAIDEKLTTTLSTKGQVILPKAIRRQRRWRAGTRLVVENTAEGVLLWTDAPFPRTEPKDVFRCLSHGGPPKTLTDMAEGIAEEARRRHARHRY